MELLLVFIGVVVIVLVISSLARRSKAGQSQRRKQQHDDHVDTGDDTEDMLITGLILGDMLDNDNQGDLLLIQILVDLTVEVMVDSTVAVLMVGAALNKNSDSNFNSENSRV